MLSSSLVACVLSAPARGSFCGRLRHPCVFCLVPTTFLRVSQSNAYLTKVPCLGPLIGGGGLCSAPGRADGGALQGLRAAEHPRQPQVAVRKRRRRLRLARRARAR